MLTLLILGISQQNKKRGKENNLCEKILELYPILAYYFKMSLWNTMFSVKGRVPGFINPSKLPPHHSHQQLS